MSSYPFHVGKIFVFGSNLAGIHGAGAAKEALERYGAKWGIGAGRQGNSYASPTKDFQLRTLPLEIINRHVRIFLSYARHNPNERFFITALGTGLAGYAHAQIAPMFRNASSNCEFPPEWKEWL